MKTVITIPQDNRNIKKALQAEFKDYKISIRNGSGTAYGWKEIRIETDIEYTKKDELNQVYHKAYDIVCKVGKKIYTYLSDDNYERKEILISVEPISTEKNKELTDLDLVQISQRVANGTTSGILDTETEDGSYRITWKIEINKNKI